ncbi:MAG TPA: FAD-dependent oxidoreductase [Rhizobacter sp.]|nr:FAD-dependent oxidoreductase [Rhizobacter sp.]
MERIAVIGSGIAGLAAARGLSRLPAGHHVTLFEGGAHFGGHANTVDVTLGGVTHGVDTGFLVYNERTYPQLVKMFAELAVEVAASDMSFSVQARTAGLEWSGCNLASVFAQRRNLARPAFWRMLSDIARFNRLTSAIAQRGEEARLGMSIGAFLDAHGFSPEFRQWYFLPMVGCIWSCPSEQMLAFPIATLIRFCHNHGLLQVTDRPQWYTVKGGSRHYVKRIVVGLADARLNTPVRGVRRVGVGALVKTDAGVEHFDQVVFACHSDQALRLLGDDATADEAHVLGAIRYQPNRAVLHTDATLMPTRRRAWAAWNYESGAEGEGRGVCLHYWLNRLQPLPWQQPVIVSLNPLREPRADSVVRSVEYDHPVFDLGAIAAQRRLPEIQGQRRTWFCGAWTGYGFHEDGLTSGLAVVAALAHPSDARLKGAA